MKKSELIQIIREEIQRLQENVKRKPNKGEWVTVYDKNYGTSDPLTILYINSNKIGVKRKSHSGSIYNNVVNIRDLSTMRYYKDLLSWIKTGDDSHIDGKTYEGLYDLRLKI